MDRLKDKIAIVTGGGSGIGRAICLVLAKEGARVAVIVNNNIQGGKETVDEILKIGGIAKLWQLDVTKEQDVEKIFQDIVHEFGTIDILVNNAGIHGVHKPTHEITEEEWDNVMNINVKGVFFCTKYVIPYMLKNGRGSIINISSNAGIVGSPGGSLYHASKAAVRLITKCDALSYSKNNIRVNSIIPGAIRTPMVTLELPNAYGISPGEMEKKLASKTPLGHIGEPEDIAYGVLYLASDESKFITGSDLVIDGGLTA
jgi:NAD(P)-dependent dehydrogenase (short-subunit alcohol dehydrogenase family)